MLEKLKKWFGNTELAQFLSEEFSSIRGDVKALEARISSLEHPAAASAETPTPTSESQPPVPEPQPESPEQAPAE